MEIEYADKNLEQIEVSPKHGGQYLPAIVKGFRKRIQAIRAAHDERDLYNVRGNGFEPLKGNRSHQHSLVLTGNWRLIVELVKGPDNQKKVRVVEIVDYH